MRKLIVSAALGRGESADAAGAKYPWSVNRLFPDLVDVQLAESNSGKRAPERCQAKDDATAGMIYIFANTHWMSALAVSRRLPSRSQTAAKSHDPRTLTAAVDHVPPFLGCDDDVCF
jgi:hypothetical protein